MKKNIEQLKGTQDVTTKDNPESKDTEGRLQAQCYEWFNNTFTDLRGLLYHVPNGEKRDRITAARLKGLGVVAGIPDLVFHYRAKTYFLELKKPNGKGRLSDDQNKIIKQLDRQRFIVWVLNDFETFKYIINSIVFDKSQQFTFGLTKEDYFYKDKVFKYIYSLGDCEVVEIAKVCEEENQSKFINYVTEFLVEGYDKLAGFELLFTPDYKAFYKKLDGTQNKVEYENRQKRP